MAELVDAPDSKSGHFGGVGSIPSTPTIKQWVYFADFTTGLSIKLNIKIQVGF